MNSEPEESVLRGKRLHPDLAKRVVPRFHAGFYDDAVLNAFKVVEVRLRAITGAQEVGVDLVKVAFNPSGGVLADLNACAAEREGLHLLFRGAFLAFRNAPAHRFMDLDEEAAFDLIVFANRLLLLAEEANQRHKLGPASRPDAPDIQYGTLAAAGPMMLDTDNDGTTEIVLLKPGRHLRDVLPYDNEGTLADPSQPIAIYKTTHAGLEPAEMEKLGTEVLWGLDDVLLADVDGDGLNEVLCALTGMGTQGAYLLVYKYRHGRYEVLRGASQDFPGRDASAPPLAAFLNGLVADVDGDEKLEIVSHSKPGPLPIDVLPAGHPPEAFGEARLIWKWDISADLFRIARRDVKVFGPGGWDDGLWEPMPVS